MGVERVCWEIVGASSRIPGVTLVVVLTVTSSSVSCGNNMWDGQLYQ